LDENSSCAQAVVKYTVTQISCIPYTMCNHGALNVSCGGTGESSHAKCSVWNY